MSCRLIVGCMTGTSLDGLDVALISLEGTGLACRPRFLRGLTRSLGDLGPSLRSLAEGRAADARTIATTMRDFALLHLDTVRELLAGERCDLVAVHGQTVVHAPPVSWQLFQPAPLAHGLGVPVVCDLRAADLALGGQGAPLSPLGDWILYRHPKETRIIVNLGGFANLTGLPAGGGIETVHGRDVCACNQLLDAIARRCFDQAYDVDGRSAQDGHASSRAKSALDGALERQSHSGRSLGTGDELATLVEGLAKVVPGPDLARSACAAIAEAIGAAGGPGHYVLAGGGLRNRTLQAELKRTCESVIDSDALGVPSLWREAILIAVLGALSQDRTPGSLPQVTGVRDPAPIAGLWCLP